MLYLQSKVIGSNIYIFMPVIEKKIIGQSENYDQYFISDACDMFEICIIIKWVTISWFVIVLLFFCQNRTLG